jgi:hypothetical protein
MEQRKNSRIRQLMWKEGLQDEGNKRMGREKIPGSDSCCGLKDSRIRGTKEWRRENIPGSGEQCGKKDSRIRGTKKWSHSVGSKNYSKSLTNFIICYIANFC